jgi:hypothetical protein
MKLTYDNPLEAVIYDCGGPERVYRVAKISKQSVWQWMRLGRLPASDLRGSTKYSEMLAGMQKQGRLSPAEIRRIGYRV